MSENPPLRAAFAGDFDPDLVPVRDASTILVLDDRPDLHVLMLRRKARSDFVGGMMVFPGGGLDEADRDPVEAARVRGEVAEGQLSYLMAAVRETFEEVGVLLASGPVPARVFDEREAVQREVITIGGLLERFDLEVDADRIYPIARWITPVGPPRRYDTMFFACAMPPGQHAISDDDEAEHVEWVRPGDAFARWERGEYIMLPPTTAMLQLLRPFRTTTEVIAAIERSPGAWETAVVVGNERGSYRVLLPGDADYDPSAGRSENGWVRLLASEQ